MYHDFREFLTALKKQNEVITIKAEVDPVFEITEITERAQKENGLPNKALFFKKVKGFDIPVITNTFGSFKRMQLALGIKSYDEIVTRIKDLTEISLPKNFWEKLSYIPKIKEISDIFPKIVNNAPCQEIIIKDKPDVTKFPILHCWPMDGGKYITLPLVFTKNPLTNHINIGMYRLQVFDECTLGMHWQIHKDGARYYNLKEEKNEKIEVAVAIGAEPALTYSATAPLPTNVSEILFAGFLRQKGVELTKCITVDLMVPATSEIVLEGYVNPHERRLEGPFCDHTGFVCAAEEYPVFHITAITHRKNPIYTATIVGQPPCEDAYFGKATERIFLPILQLISPDIIDIDLPVWSVFHNCILVKIKKRYPAHARQIANLLWGLNQLCFSKFIVVFDENVNIHDYKEAFWIIGANVEPKRDTFLIEGPMDVLDHASPYIGFGSKMGIDATTKWKNEGILREYPDKITMSKEIKELVNKKWQIYFSE